MKRILVTTSISETFSSGEPILFLGHWCLKTISSELLSQLDYKIAEPYPRDGSYEKKYEDLYFAQAIGNNILKDLHPILNEIHGVSYSLRYWDILIGHWVQRFSILILNRYASLMQAFEDYEISETITLKENVEYLAKESMLSFSQAIGDDLWNHYLYVDLLRAMQITSEEFKYKSGGVIKTDNIQIRHSESNSIRNKTKKWIKLFLSIFNNIYRNTDAVIVNSYMPRFDEMILKILFGQFPAVFNSPNVDLSPFDNKIRKKINLNTRTCCELEKIIRILLPKFFPRAYLEGYMNHRNIIRNLKWPSNPKFIFTSNNFMMDEVFKYYVAEKTHHGCLYFTGQHGSNYGTYKSYENWPEFTTCDKFLTWGWSSDTFNQVVPCFNFKISSFRSQGYDQDGGLLLVQRGPGSRDGPQDRYFEHMRYQNFTTKFFQSLSSEVKKKSTIRLHAGSIHYGTKDVEIWNKVSEGATLDYGSSSIWNYIKKSRLVVFSYDSTGMLESLALNIPTIGFWMGGLVHNTKEAVLYYQELKNCGIVYDDPELAAAAINMNWEDLESWWNEPLRQKAIKDFCSNFSKKSKHPSIELKRILQILHSREGVLS